MPDIKQTPDPIPTSRGLDSDEFAQGEAAPQPMIGEDEQPAVADLPATAETVSTPEVPQIVVPAPIPPPAPAPVDKLIYSSIIASGPGYLRVATNQGNKQLGHGTLAWRNNNPGNMMYGSRAQKFGAIGKDYKGLAVFPTYDDGANAQKDLLFNPDSVYYSQTLQEAIARYAPASDGNNPKEYAVFVANRAKLPRTILLSKLSPSQQDAMIEAMRAMEGYKEGEITSI